MSDLKKKLKEDNENHSISVEAVTEVPQIAESNVELAPRELFVETLMKIMPTLPESFKSLVDCSIDITNENRKPQDIIELLGDLLGVNDYKTSVASFWFLDFIALQVLRYDNVLDNHGKSVMVSWLAGEMKLIQAKKFSREDFLREMEDIFIDCAEKLSRGRSVMHWDLMLTDVVKEIFPIEEEMVEEPKEKRTSHPKIAKRRVSSRSDRKRTPSGDRAKLSEHSLRKKSFTTDDSGNIVGNDKGQTISKVDDFGVLEIIIEATYNMYGNNFHYALIIASFVKPVQRHEYILPFSLRTPRPTKMFDSEKQNKNIEKAEVSAAQQKGKDSKKKTKDNKKTKKKSKDAETNQIGQQSVPPIILTDDEILMKKREFILPLMEANETSSVLTAYAQAN